MTKTVKASLFAAAALVSLLGHSESSYAASGCDCGSMSAIINAATDRVVDAIAKTDADLMNRLDDVRDDLQKQTTQLSGHVDNLGAIFEKIQTAQTQDLAKQKIQGYVADAQIKMAVTKSACNSGSVGEQLTKYKADQSTHTDVIVKELNDHSLGATEDSKDGVFKAAQASLAIHLSKYCGAASAATGMCTDKGEMGDADIKAKTMLGPLDTPEMIEAARQYARRIVSAEPENPLPKDAYKTAAGAMEHERRLNQQAKRSMAQEVVAEMLAERTSGVRTTQAYEMTRRVIDQSKSAAAGQNAQTPKQWREEMQGAEEAVLLRELAYMGAWSLNGQFEVIERMDQTNALLSVILAEMLDQHKPSETIASPSASSTAAAK